MLGLCRINDLVYMPKMADLKLSAMCIDLGDELLTALRVDIPQLDYISMHEIQNTLPSSFLLFLLV